MLGYWTFGRKLGVGFALVVVCALLIGVVAVYALQAVVASKDRVISVNAENLIDAERLHAVSERTASAARGFLLGRDPELFRALGQARADFDSSLSKLSKQVYTPEGQRLVAEVRAADVDYTAAIDEIIALRRTDATLDTVAKQFEARVLPRRSTVERQVEALIAEERQGLSDARQRATDAATRARNAVIGIEIAALLLAAGTALFLARTLSSQIGSAVRHVQSSSAELQAAASQQATGAKEQSTAMNEITTTISELLATSRQIAESARRVSQIAGETAAAGRGGELTVQKAVESIAGIKRQVDLIVAHMLELGKKSQQIGGILEIINELAEQTNILAINATIESAGAGESGKRFAVVAEEIRKLADRVGGSTREIRALVDDIRAAVNTTVMATEGGSKAVDTGSKQFGEVAASFRQIASLVGTTTEAAKEIELSTKQQASAVEQVNVAISNVAQAAKETETSSSQTLQTSSQLSSLSRDLARLVQEAAASG